MSQSGRGRDFCDCVVTYDYCNSLTFHCPGAVDAEPVDDIANHHHGNIHIGHNHVSDA